MTLLVGVLCSNGAVIAADRQAMHGAMGQMTVGQAVTKVRIIGSNSCLRRAVTVVSASSSPRSSRARGSSLAPCLTPNLLLIFKIISGC
jgi:hypothetical protein